MTFAKDNTFTDYRDGTTYKTVKIGKQTWFAENLAFECERSKVYNNDLSNLPKYGRLYDWDTAKNICPLGWHLPTNEEWNILYSYANSIKSNYESLVAGKYLRATYGWESEGLELGLGYGIGCFGDSFFSILPDNSEGNGEDKFGFSALPGGYCLPNGKFFDAGYIGKWWTATEYNTDEAYNRYMFCSNQYAIKGSGGYFNKMNLFSVRCISD